MQFLDLAAMDAALKELYSGQVVENLVYRDNPTLAMLPKQTDFGGKYYPIPIITGVSQGRSATFANAQGNQSAVEVESFLLTRASDYSIATIDNQTMLASATDKMTFINGAKIVIDGAIRSATLSLASALFRSGTGVIGQIGQVQVTGSGPYTATITLSEINDIVQFERNQYLVVSATDGGAVGSVVGVVTTVNRSTGVFTVECQADPAAEWTQGKYLQVQGDTNLKVKGFEGWLPAAGPQPGDNWFGVDRTQDATRLAGISYNGTSQSIEEAYIDAAALVAREGGMPTMSPTNFASYAALEKSLGSKVQYVDLKGPAEIAFRGININGANTMIKVFPDRSCKAKKAYLLQMDTWKLMSLGDAPQILRYGDGMEMLRVANADAGEVRVGYYAQLCTNAPGWNANITLSA